MQHRFRKHFAECRPRFASRGCHAAAALSFVLFFAAGARGQVPQPVIGTAQHAIVEKMPQHDAVFEFHSSFWLNLHLRLYEDARRQKGLSLSQGVGAPRLLAQRSAESAWEKNEQDKWNAAVAYYAANFAQHDLQFDETMAAITNRLASLEDCVDISGKATTQCASGLRPELIAALEAAAPVYREREWPQQDRSNRLWVANAAPLVRELSPALSRKQPAFTSPIGRPNPFAWTWRAMRGRSAHTPRWTRRE